MRSVWFLLDANIMEVRTVFANAGFERINDQRWNYPPGMDACLYVTCCEYDQAQDDPEELAELHPIIGDATFKVRVCIDVSGRVPGDAEVRFVARCLLERFEGFAFDDFTWPSHAWSLADIQHGIRHDGLVFFDYLGFHKRTLSAGWP